MLLKKVYVLFCFLFFLMQVDVGNVCASDTLAPESMSFEQVYYYAGFGFRLNNDDLNGKSEKREKRVYDEDGKKSIQCCFFPTDGYRQIEKEKSRKNDVESGFNEKIKKRMKSYIKRRLGRKIQWSNVNRSKFVRELKIFRRKFNASRASNSNAVKNNSDSVRSSASCSNAIGDDFSIDRKSNEEYFFEYLVGYGNKKIYKLVMEVDEMLKDKVISFQFNISEKQYLKLKKYFKKKGWKKELLQKIIRQEDNKKYGNYIFNYDEVKNGLDPLYIFDKDFKFKNNKNNKDKITAIGFLLYKFTDQA